MKQQEDIVIADFQKGIADSPHLGFADMRNIDIYSEPGVARVNYELREWTYNANSAGLSSSTFTADAATNFVTTSGASVFAHEWNLTSFAQPVTVSNSGGALPAGLSANTVYYVFGASGTTQFKLASTYANADAGTAVDITDAGTGTHTITAVKPGQIKHLVTDYGTGYHYALDTNGRVWKNKGNNWFVVSGNTLTSQSANGLAVWKGYLLVFRNTAIDLISLSTTDTNATWTNGWQTDLTSGIHHAVHGQDDILYICNDRYVASLSEVGTFNPGSGATYTWNTQALDLPAGYKTRRLAELGHLLMVGASRDNVSESRVFPWDRTSDSFELPVIVPDAPLNAMQPMGNKLYVSAGYMGSVWVTNTVQSGLAFRIPTAIFGEARYSTAGILSMCAFQERLFMGVSSGTTSGIFSYNPETAALVLEHRLSSESYSAASSNPIQINAIQPVTSDQFMTAWYDSQAPKGAIDSNYVSNSSKHTSYSAYLVSRAIQLGTAADGSKRQVSTAEVQLAEDLASGQGVRLSYRKSTSGNFTTIGTADFSTNGAVKSFAFAANIVDAEVLQIKAELTTSGANGTAATPKLLTIRLR